MLTVLLLNNYSFTSQQFYNSTSFTAQLLQFYILTVLKLDSYTVLQLYNDLSRAPKTDYVSLPQNRMRRISGIICRFEIYKRLSGGIKIIFTA